MLFRTPILIIEYLQPSEGQVQSTGFRDGGLGFESRYQKICYAWKKSQRNQWNPNFNCSALEKVRFFGNDLSIDTPFSMCLQPADSVCRGLRHSETATIIGFLVFILFWFFMYAQPFAFHFLLRPTKEMGLSSYTHNVCLSVILVWIFNAVACLLGKYGYFLFSFYFLQYFFILIFIRWLYQ